MYSSLKSTTILQYHILSLQHHILINYLTPVVISSLVFIFNVAADSCLALQHFRDENPIFASLTFFLLYVPVLGSLLFTLSNVEVWPEEKGCGWDNVKWFVKKIIQHASFPVWATYRFAEQLFWSIEALRSSDKEEIEECLKQTGKNSVFELFQFLQAYLQAAPQILFQLYIIFQQNSNFNKETVNLQVFSIIMSLIKMAITTTSYQRFKSQKSAGRQYPWKKESNLFHLNTIQETYRDLGSLTAIYETSEEQENVKEENSSSEQENSETEVDQNQSSSLTRKNSGLSVSSSQFDINVRKKQDQPDFVLPLKIIFYRGLPEDDAAGKLISFLWWFCFILPRMLALSAFAYFYPTEILWLSSSHYIICLAFLLYDAHTSNIPYYRAVFILFTAYVYMFCLIEFKIKFKKVRFIYNGYFALVYLENFVMTLIWYHGQDFIFSDWWFRYVFYLILGNSILSVSSMLFYIFILKPKKVTLRQEYRNSKVL